MAIARAEDLGLNENCADFPRSGPLRSPPEALLEAFRQVLEIYELRLVPTPFGGWSKIVPASGR